MRAFVLVLVAATALATLALLNRRQSDPEESPPLRTSPVARAPKAVPVLTGEKDGIRVLVFDAGVSEVDQERARALRAGAWGLEEGWTRVVRILIENTSDATVAFGALELRDHEGQSIGFRALPMPPERSPTRPAVAAWVGEGPFAPILPGHLRQTAVALADRTGLDRVKEGTLGGVPLLARVAVRTRLESILDGSLPALRLEDLAVDLTEAEARTPPVEEEDEQAPTGSRGAGGR